MRLSAILVAAAFTVGSAAAAHANLIQNGDFSQTSLVTPYPTQFGTGSGNGYTATNFITGWTGNNGYEIWYPNATAAIHDNATGEWTSTGEEKLYPTLTAPPGGGAFVELDGDQTNGIQSSISQMVNDLVIGTTYTLSFEWGGSQLQSRTGATTEYLQVSLGNSTQKTQTLDNASGGFTGWYATTLEFTADATSELLSFLSVGTPTGYPPVAVLADVSLTPPSSNVPVPEPSSFALLGAGLLGIGFIARRRPTNRQAS